jgi:hypothetical protein
MIINWSQETYIKACQFAANAHKGQKVPGTNLPYVVHPSFALWKESVKCLIIENSSG